MGLYKTVETSLNLTKEIFLGKEKNFSSSVIIFHAAMILISFMFVYIFSYSTSFRYDFLGGDSSIFQSVGKYWAQGYLPYVDLFEHKGPLLFLINAIGYVIYPRAGIMVPQIICLYLSCVFVWRAMKLYSSKWNLLFFLLVLIHYAAHYQEGNHVEEYSVLFLSAAVYFFLRALKDSEGKKFFHPPLYGFIYGFGFGACILIRASDAAQICCQSLLVAIFLLQARDFKNLLQNFLSFCAGFAVIFLPFVIYFAAHGALYEMFFGMIIFNMKYSAVQLQEIPLDVKLTYFALHFMPVWILIVASLSKILSDKKNRLARSGLFCGVMILIFLLNIRLFRHYCIILFPLAPIIFAVLADLLPSVKNFFFAKKNFLQKFVLVAVVIPVIVGCEIYVAICCAHYIAPFKLYISEEGVAEIQRQDLAGILFLTPTKLDLEPDLDYEKFSTVEELAKLIPDAEKNSVVTWGYYCTSPHWVLETNIKPRERVFFLNRTFGIIYPPFREEWFDHIRKDYPLWILCGVDPEKNSDGLMEFPIEDSDLEQILEEKYSLKGEVFIFPQVMKLYRLKQ